MGGRDPAEALALTERELVAERAATLARIAGTLEELLDRLSAIRSALASAQAGSAERTTLRSDYQELREKARLYRWYLRVQREAVGFLRHDGLDERYPIPEALEG